MSAGTVISGGFPGRVAQEVQPNQKCNGCLHYDGQAGRTGACTIGLRPWLCGDGEMADVGYAPLVRGAGSYLPDMSNHAVQAPSVGPQDVSTPLHRGGSSQSINVQVVSLGAEHVEFVKSFVDQHARVQRSMCRGCQNSGAIGIAPANVDPQSCSCTPANARDVAKALVGKLSNQHRSLMSLDDLVDFVREVEKGGFKGVEKGSFFTQHGKYETTRGAGGAHNVDFHPHQGQAHRLGTHSSAGAARHAIITHARKFAVGSAPPDKTARVVKPKANASVEKSLYADDWINQFKGTPLFKEAHALCEQELSMEEAQLKRREERAKHDKQRQAAVSKLEKPEGYDWQEEDSQRQRLRLAKQRLSLKLAKHHQSSIAKSDDVEKAVDDTKHSHIVTGKLQAQPRGFSSLRAASRHVDKLDNKYGASVHSYKRNPNFKPSATAATHED